MTDTASTYAQRLEAATSGGNLSEELQKTTDALKASMTKDAADKMLVEITQELHSRGALPKMARAWSSANFNDLDLDGNGSISAAELDRMLKTDLLKGATNPFEKQLLRYMQVNREKIAAAVNDEWGTDTNITRKDLTEHEKQAAAAANTAIMAKRMVDAFGKQENFRRLDANNDGFIADAELKAALDGKRGAFSQEERELIQFMRDNRVPIAKSVDDQKLWENKISLKDIAAFAEKNKPAALQGPLAVAKDFSEKAPAQTAADKHLPDLILEFGKANFRALDHSGDGKITRGEIQKLTQSDFWRRGISQNDMRVMAEMDKKLEYIQRSSKDEWWYKDTKGISSKDLEAYAKFEAGNRRDLPTTPGDHVVKLMVGGVEREAIMHIPPGYDGKKPTKIIYECHCFTGNAQQQAETTRMNERADKPTADDPQGVIVVYLNAKGWFGDHFRQFNLNNKPSYRVDELAFFETLDNTLKSKLNIDSNRVYIAGFSNGGMLAQEIAAKYPDRIAAMACVGGCQTGTVPDKPMNTLIFHGDKDVIVPPGGASNVLTDRWPTVKSVKDAIVTYGARFGRPILFPNFKSVEQTRDAAKAATGTDSSEFDRPAPGVSRETYTNSSTGKQVVVYRHVKGHVYPGDPRPYLDSEPLTDIDATDIMMDFFRKHRLNSSVRAKETTKQ